MMIPLVCLALNIVAFFYLHAWRPVVDFVRAFRQSRQIRAWRVAGLLLLILAVNVAPVQAQSYSDGDDALVARYQYQAQHQDTTGYPALDNAIRYVWNNCGKLMLLFGLLALASILNSKLKAQNECYGDVLRREMEERETASQEEAEESDDSDATDTAIQLMQTTTRMMQDTTQAMINTTIANS